LRAQPGRLASWVRAAVISSGAGRCFLAFAQRRWARAVEKSLFVCDGLAG